MGVKGHLTCALQTEEARRQRAIHRSVVTFEAERGHLEAAAGVRVCGDEEEVIANGEGGNV